MDEDEARTLLAAEIARVKRLLDVTEASGEEDRSQSSERSTSDAAQPLSAEGIDDAVIETLQQRLEVLQRAEQRLGTGQFGRSVLSGEPIPDDRLRADPAAELTIEEARAQAER